MLIYLKFYINIFYLDRALRWKTEMLLELGFDLGIKGRTYRYLHHSQSQLKDKQFWFYYYNGQTNFSFEEAFAWMGDFQEERIVAKHAARIAQCFTSAEATIQVKSKIKNQKLKIFYLILLIDSIRKSRIY